MLEHYCRCPKRRAGWERNLLAPFLREAAGIYEQRKYRYKYAQRILRYMACFGDWLDRKRIPIEQVTESDGRDFLDWFIPHPHDAFIFRKQMVRSAVYRVLALIQNKHPLVPQPSPAQAEASRYIDHLRRNRGLAEGTINGHRRGLEEFLVACFRQGAVRHELITAERIHAYVRSLPCTPRNSKRRSVCSALRGYFRFLQLQGSAVRHLSAVVPLVPAPRAALSPKVLAPPEVRQFLRSIRRTSATGRRDYAAILCMTDMGMRVGDVARLSLDDIDWHEGSVRLNNHKQGRPYRLPLPRRLGQALADYLAKGRPTSSQRELFLRHAQPHGLPVTVDALKAAVSRYWMQAGLRGRFSGTHVLRHSAATRMKQKGLPLKSIADVLGHRSLQSTTLYAQVDLPALRRTAQPWPEDRP